MTLTLADYVEAYAQIGIAVFPLRPRAKKPYGRTTGLLGASPDPDLVAGWWAGREPLPLKADVEDRTPVFAGHDANIGLPTGPASGCWVLDEDGRDAASAMACLEAYFGELPETVEQLTGKGRHRCFAWPASRPVRNSQSAIGPGIDVRGDGGYIVAAPSIHPSGRPYQWAPGRSPSECQFAAAPDWLLDLVAPIEAPAKQHVARPHVAMEGMASRYGEKALAGACDDIRRAPAGTQSETLWKRSLSIGALVLGGEIRASYAETALIAAGMDMKAAREPWTSKTVSDVVRRAFSSPKIAPRGAPERTTAPRPSDRPSRPAQRPEHDDQRVQDGAGLWASARDARCHPVRAWLERNGLDPDGLPGALRLMRAHPAAQNTAGGRIMALLAPMTACTARAVSLWFSATSGCLPIAWRYASDDPPAPAK